MGDIKKISWDAEILLNTLTFNGQKATVLLSKTGFEKKQLRNAIRELRLAGFKVCSGNNGYWLWDGKDDTWNHTKAQIKSRRYMLDQLIKAMEDIPLEGQEVLNV